MEMPRNEDVAHTSPKQNNKPRHSKIHLNAPTGLDSRNPRYDVPSTAAMLERINLFTQEPDRPLQTDAINNVYELPSIGRAVCYLHAAVGFPTKATWIKAIRKVNYLSWPLINVKNVNKHFPESEET